MTTNLEERAREFVHSQVIQLWESQEAYDEAVANLSALLIQVQAEALEAAARIADRAGDMHSPLAARIAEDIRALAQAAAPAATNVRYCGHEALIGKPCPVCYPAAAPAKETKNEKS